MIAEEDIQAEGEMPRFVLVELSQLELLLQRCFECGRLPGGKNKGKPRPIQWTKSGTNMTAVIRCTCKNDARIRWPTQSFIPGMLFSATILDIGTETRCGNLAVTAAAQVAPILYNDLSAFFKAASIPLITKQTFLRLSKAFVWPSVENTYYAQISDILREIPDPANIGVDGQFDSPGFSAEFCAVSAIEETAQQVVGFEVVHKSEVQNVSARMELAGVKKCLSSLKNHVDILNVVIDKHPSIVKYLRENGYSYNLDAWHRLKSLKKDLRSYLKSLDTREDKILWKDLGNRFIRHVYYSVENSEGDSDVCKELVYSFFLHIQDIHHWHPSKFSDLILVQQGTKVCKRFEVEKFNKVTECYHALDLNHENRVPVNPESPLFQKLLLMVAKTTFMNDLKKLKVGNATSCVESFNSVAIHYRPKQKYFPRKGFEYRTMLAAISFNENRLAERRGDRKVTSVYECYSKAKGDRVTKVQKGPICDEWKRSIVDKALEMKQKHGPGEPALEADEEDEELDIIPDRLDILDFSDEDDFE